MERSTLIMALVLAALALVAWCIWLVLSMRAKREEWRRHLDHLIRKERARMKPAMDANDLRADDPYASSIMEGMGATAKRPSRTTHKNA